MPAIGLYMDRGVLNVVFSAGGGGCSISSTYCMPLEGVRIRISALRSISLERGGSRSGVYFSGGGGGMFIAVLYY